MADQEWMMRKARVALAGTAALTALALQVPAAGAAPTLKLRQVVAAPAAHTTKAGGRLSSVLATLSRPSVRSASAAAQARALSVPVAGPGSLETVGGDVVVDVRASTTSPGLVQAVRDAGARVLSTSPQYRTVTVAVAPAALTSLAAVPDVENVQEVLEPMRSGFAGTSAITCPGGSVTSEADGQMQAALARSAYGVNGSGQIVGVLSDSFNRNGGAATTPAQDIVTGDLPGAANPCGFTTPVNVLQDDPGAGEDEGRAMIQTVHDLAPGADLAFATAEISETNFANNITSLRTTAHASVIADDITYFDEPFFQDGPVAVAADAAVAAGVPYFSSAANNNFIQNGVDRASWEAPSFRDDGGCPPTIPAFEVTCMNFGTASAPGNEMPFLLDAGGTLQLDFQWAEPWNGVDTDYDIFLVNDAGTVLASSTRINPGGTGTQRPFEILSFHTGASQRVWLVVGNATGTTGPRMKWTMTQPIPNGVLAVVNSIAPGDLTGPAIFGHNGTATGMSVGAVPFDNSATMEEFSSRGPVTHYFGPVSGTTPAAPLAAPQVLAKPDVAATDGGATTFFAELLGGVWRFFGTSESAPQAAAVAALEKQAAPGATAVQVMNAQKSTASPVGAFGVRAQGAGLVNALGALTALKGLPTAPRPVTGLAIGVTTSAARLTGSVDPRAVATSSRFQFGPTTAYGSATPLMDAGARLGAVPTAANIAGLAPGTTYHYRLLAVRRGVTVAAGADRTFTTLRPVVTPPPAPKPRFSVAGVRRQHLSGRTISLRVFCSLACSGRVTGRLKIAGRRGTIKLTAINVNFAAGKTQTFKLRLTKKQAAAVRKALRRHKRVTVNATISLRSGATTKTLRKRIVIIR